MLISKKEMEAIIRMAFEKGEEWGVCHSGWLIPSEDQSELRFLQAMNDCLKMLYNMKGID